jgi:probable HAF family extracellular repeat protein
VVANRSRRALVLVPCLVTFACQPVPPGMDGVDPAPEDPAAEEPAPAATPTATPIAGPTAPGTTRLLVKPMSRRRLALALGQTDELAGRLRRVFPEIGVEVRELAPGTAVADAVEQYRGSGRYEYVEPDYPITPAAAPNDVSYANGSQWNMNNTGQTGGVADADIDAPEAWTTRSDASSVVVAVADSGVNYTHEDLAANMWKNPGEVAGNGLDDDGNGFIDDVYGINAITDSGDPRDDFPMGHGTHVSGIIGAVGNNGKGVSGVAWKAKILACKLLDANGNGNLSDAITCLAYARARGAKVINMSFQGPYSLALRDAIEAARASGLIVVAAAGNGGINADKSTVYPASFDLDNLISVAASDAADKLLPTSNYGAAAVDLAAPGGSILSTHNGSSSAYVTLSGTSMAAPHVTGALALMRAQSPTASYTQIINRLFATVDKPAAMAGKTRTGGRLNLQRALTSTATRPINDAFSARTGYPAGACLANGSNADATAETGEPRHAGVAGGKSIWWSWTAPVAGQVTVTTDRSRLDTLLAVYTGTAVNALTAVASNDNDGSKTTSKVTFSAAANTTYHIAVDGKNGATGEISVAVLQQLASGSYTLTDLGDAANVLGASEARKINAAGEIVGYVERTADVLTAFRRSAAGAFSYLPTLGGTSAAANSLNGNGDAVGWSQLAGNANRNAVMWKKDGTTVNLGRLPGLAFCAAHDVNDGQRVVGSCSSSAEDTNPRAFLWQAGVMTDLGAIDNGYASARAISNAGRIVGRSTIVGNRGTFRAVEWVNGVPQELTTYAGEALDINEAGQIVGFMNANGTLHPMLIQAGTVSDLIPSFPDYGQAWAINGTGKIVGFMGDTAVMYNPGAASTINGLVAWDSCGGNLYSATSINDGGHIVGQVMRLGVPHAYLASPPTTMAAPRTLAPTADSYVRDGNATTNFGTATTVDSKAAASAGTNRWGYFKFDTASVSTVGAAKLRLWGALNATDTVTLRTQVFSCTNTSWTETGLTWNNKPASATAAMSEVSLANSTSGKYYEWDVTSWVKAEKLAGRSVVTLVLKHPVSSTTFAKWSSRENAANKPELVITP